MSARRVDAVLTGRSASLHFVVGGQAVELNNIAATREGWILSRCWAAAEYLQRSRSLSGHDPYRAAAIAVVLWSNESGWGAAEFNWNAGGIHCSPTATATPGTEPVNPAVNDSCIRFTSGGREDLRDYNDFLGFVTDYFNVAERLHRGYLSETTAGLLPTIQTLQRAGYSGTELTQQELVSIYRRIYNTLSPTWQGHLFTPEQVSHQWASGGGGGAGGAGKAALIGLGLWLLFGR